MRSSELHENPTDAVSGWKSLLLRLETVLANLCLLSVFGWMVVWLVKPLPLFATGVDWGQYIMGAEYIWRWVPELNYPSWRHPLYPYLLGLGAVDSYIQSARIFNAVGMLSGLLSFTWLGYRLKRPWLSVMLGLMWCFHPLIQDARDWINPYPLWGGLSGCFVLLVWELARAGRSVQSRDGHWKRFVLIGLTSCVEGILLWLDGRSIWMVAGSVAFLLWHRKGPEAIVLGASWMLVLWLEQLFLQRYQIHLYGLFEQFELQRTFLFRENMAQQLFPSPSDVMPIVSACKGANPSIWEVDWTCFFQMGVGNIETWHKWGLLPSVWVVLLLALGLIYGVYQRTFSLENRTLMVALLLMLTVPLLLSGLVWQPPRYLFWTLWLWVLAMGGGVYLLLETKKLRWLGVLGLFLLVDWIVSAPDLKSVDRPVDWDTIGRLLDAQVGEKILDCTERQYALTKLSTRRHGAWPMKSMPTQCQTWIQSDELEAWGVDTILTEQPFEVSNGWTLETGFDFRSGVLWMYRTSE